MEKTVPKTVFLFNPISSFYRCALGRSLIDYGCTQRAIVVSPNS